MTDLQLYPPGLTAMSITPANVNEWRARTKWILRGLAFLLITVATYLCLKRIAFGLITGDFGMAIQVWQDIGETHSISRGTAMLLIGSLIAVFAGSLSHWIIALPPDTCPRCGHARTPGGATKCTECGLEGVNID